MAYLKVPRKTILGASKFLDFVQDDNGASTDTRFRPKGRPRRRSGLLCRMYLGWKQDNPSLKAGVEYLARDRAEPTTCTYNYYATQVMRHYGGEFWEAWNAKMRDQLVDSPGYEGARARAVGTYHASPAC